MMFEIIKGKSLFDVKIENFYRKWLFLVTFHTQAFLMTFLSALCGIILEIIYFISTDGTRNTKKIVELARLLKYIKIEFVFKMKEMFNY